MIFSYVSRDRNMEKVESFCFILPDSLQTYIKNNFVYARYDIYGLILSYLMIYAFLSIIHSLYFWEINDNDIPNFPVYSFFLILFIHFSRRDIIIYTKKQLTCFLKIKHGFKIGGKNNFVEL